eukprot:Gb_40676 [translate_table: standard]
MVLGGLRLGLWVKYLAGLRLAPFVPTPYHVAKAMLRLADVKSSDFVIDLGCGDARLLISAAKFHGAKGYGVEMDPDLFKEAVSAIEREGLAHMISVQQKDALDTDLHNASVVTLYLSDAGNAKILPNLQKQLPENGRVVSFCWPFKDVNPLRVERVDGIGVYLYDMKLFLVLAGSSMVPFRMHVDVWHKCISSSLKMQSASLITGCIHHTDVSRPAHQLQVSDDISKWIVSTHDVVPKGLPMLLRGWPTVQLVALKETRGIRWVKSKNVEALGKTREDALKGASNYDNTHLCTPIGKVPNLNHIEEELKLNDMSKLISHLLPRRVDGEHLPSSNKGSSSDEGVLTTSCKESSIGWVST